MIFSDRIDKIVRIEGVGCDIFQAPIGKSDLIAIASAMKYSDSVLMNYKLRFVGLSRPSAVSLRSAVPLRRINLPKAFQFALHDYKMIGFRLASAKPDVVGGAVARASIIGVYHNISSPYL